MDDLISRQAAVDSLNEERCPCESDYDEGYLSMLDKAIWIIKEWLPSAQPEPHYDEWCTDCKEYDKDKHCCPRFNRVIRETLKEAQPEIIRCKDCRKHNISPRSQKDCCPLYHYRGMSFGSEYDLQFCSYAERREDAQ